MGLGSRVQSNKDKFKKETNNDTFRSLQNPGTPKRHRSTTSHFNVIQKYGHEVSNQGDVDYDKNKYSVKNRYKKMR